MDLHLSTYLQSIDISDVQAREFINLEALPDTFHAEMKVRTTTITHSAFDQLELRMEDAWPMRGRLQVLSCGLGPGT